MGQVLLRAFSFTMIIAIGIFLRSAHIVDEHAGASVKKIMINITLPAALITNFSQMESVSAEFLLIVLLGLLVNVIMLAVGAAVTRGRDASTRLVYILGLPAFNIGAFCLPFVQSFLPAVGTVTACMFDVGNSIMCTGVNYAFASAYVSGDTSGGFDLRAFFLKLVKSAPLVTYVVMFVLTLAGIRLPQTILTLIAPAAQANIFTAMLMLGLLFHLELKPEYLKQVGGVIGIRHLASVAFALLFWFLLPFDRIIRQTLVLLCFGPMSAVAPAYVGMSGGDEGLESCANSLTILCSLAEITALIIAMGIY